MAKLEFGWEEGARRVVDAGLRVTNLIGLGPFHLAEPDRWGAQRERVVRALDTATEVGAECLVFTTGPAGPLPWEEAADALEAALAPVLPEARSRGVPFAIEHTNSLRVDVGFVHTLADALDLARRLDAGVCMESTPAGRSVAPDTITAGADRLRLVQISDRGRDLAAEPARPRRQPPPRSHPRRGACRLPGLDLSSSVPLSYCPACGAASSAHRDARRARRNLRTSRRRTRRFRSPGLGASAERRAGTWQQRQ